MERPSYLNLQILEQSISVGATERRIAVHSAKKPKGEQAQATGVAECHRSIVKVPCQVLVGIVCVETHLKFFTKQFPHD